MDQNVLNYIKKMFAVESTPTWTPDYEGVIFYDKNQKRWVIGRNDGWQIIDRRFKTFQELPNIEWVDPFEYDTDEYLKSKWTTSITDIEINWTPAEITTALWLDADDSSTITLDGSDNVEQWNDKSGNDHHAAQTDSIDRPSINTSSINGLDTILFLDEFLITESAVTGVRSAFFISNSMLESVSPVLGSSSTKSHVFIRGDVESYDISIDGGNDYNGNASVDGGSLVEGGDIDLGLSVVEKQAERLWYINWDGNQSFNQIAKLLTYVLDDGELGEIILLSTIPDNATRQKIEGYLAWKWGLEANLPSNHPYKTTAPTTTYNITVPYETEELVDLGVLFIHSDTTDGSTTFVDGSDSNHTITVNGDTCHKVDYKKFGATSIYFDGDGDWLSIPASEDWNFGSGDFTIEFWYFGLSSTRQWLMGWADGSGYGGIYLEKNTSNTLILNFVSDAGTRNFLTSTNTITLNQWNHIAFIRYGDVFTLYVNGAEEDQSIHTDLVFHPQNSVLGFGRSGGYNGLYVNGYLDEIRILKGTAAWAENFVPPDESYTYILYNQLKPLTIHSDTSASGTTYGDYSMRIDALISGSINHTISRTFDEPINCTGHNVLKFDTKASRIGKNVEVSLIDTGSSGTIDWLDDWAYRIPLIIDHTKIDSDLTHFPVPITLSGTDAGSVITEVRNSVTAKSVILDVMNNWGHVSATTIRQVDFWYQGTKITNLQTDFTAYSTSEHYIGTLSPKYALDTSTSKVGGSQYNMWNSEWNEPTNQRVICVFNSPVIFDEIRINNGHSVGGDTNRGAKNVKINISSDEITDTTYNATISNSTLIFDGQFDEHVASDVEDEQILELSLPLNNKKIAVGLSDQSQLYCEIEQWDTINNKITLWTSRVDWTISSTEDTTLYLYYDGTQDDNTTYVGTPGGRTEVWNADFAAVFNFSEDSYNGTVGEVIDSTGNVTDAALSLGNPAPGATGLIGKAVDFDGDDQLSGSLSYTGPMAVSLLSHITGQNGNNCAVAEFGSYNTVGGIGCWFNNKYGYFYGAGGSYGYTGTDPAAWAHLVVNLDGSGNFEELQDLTSIKTASGVAEQSVNKVYIGYRGEGAEGIVGLIEGVFYHKSARSDAWWKSEYHAVTDNLLTFGALEEFTGSSEILPGITKIINHSYKDTWQKELINVTTNSDTYNKIEFKILNDDADNTIYIDSMSFGMPDIYWIDSFEYPTDGILRNNWAPVVEKEIPWTPEEISTALWLDAAASGTITLDGSGNVEQWSDRSGNDNHFSQDTASYRPEISVDGGISHNSTTSYKFLASNPTVNGLYAIVIVSKWYSTAGDYRHFCIAHGDTASSNGLFSTSYGGQNVQNGDGWITGVETSPKNMNRYTTPVIHFFVPSGEASMSYQTGNGASFSSRCFYGEHYEIIGLSTAPSIDDRQKIEGYLAHKWGLGANLPPDHPYKTTQPTSTVVEKKEYNVEVEWTPEYITTALWLDADDSSTITLDGSSNVEQWDDKSGSANHATGVSKPAYISVSEVVRFSNNRMTLASAIDFVGKSVFVVAKHNDTNYGQLYSHSSDNAQFRFGSNHSVQVIGSPSTWGNTTTTGALSAALHIFNFVGNASVGEIFVDGTSEATGEAQASAINFNQIGVRRTSDEPLSGDIAETIILNEPSLADRQKIEGYLAWKWGLEANLPTGHPYELAAPTHEIQAYSDVIEVYTDNSSPTYGNFSLRAEAVISGSKTYGFEKEFTQDIALRDYNSLCFDTKSNRVGENVEFSMAVEYYGESNRSYRIPFTIDHTKIDSDLTHFPVPITISGTDAEAIFDEIGENNKKIAIATEEKIQLYGEIEQWDAINNKITLWVSRSDWVISSTEDATLYLYYDGAQDDNTTYVGDPGDAAAQNVWNSDFAARYGMAQDPSGGADCIIDSTVNANHGTPYGSMTSADLVDGAIGKAIEFDGSNDKVLTDLEIGSAYQSFSFSAWMRLPSQGSTDQCAMLTNYTEQEHDGYWKIGTNNGSNIQCILRDSDRTNAITLDTPGGFDNVWTYCVGVRDANNNIFSFYKDAVLIDADTFPGNVDVTDGISSKVGMMNQGESSWNRYLKGLLDDVRIHNNAISIDWIKADYHAQTNTLLTVGEVEDTNPSSLVNISENIHHNDLNMWQKEIIDFSSLFDTSLFYIRKIAFNILNDDLDNTFYIDSMYLSDFQPPIEYVHVPLWTPAEIVTSLWLDASVSGTVILDGEGNVAQWDDRSGNENHTEQMTLEYRPKYIITSQNNLNILRFDGADDRMTHPVIVNDPDNISLFSVFKDNSDQTGIIWSHRDETTKLIQLTSQTSTEVLWQLRSSGDVLQEITGDKFTNEWVITSSWLDVTSNSHNLAINGEKGIANTTDFGAETFTSSVNSVGASYYGEWGSFFDGDIAEIIVISGTVDTETNQKMEGYLAHKWNLNNKLPYNHPYKTIPPYGEEVIEEIIEPVLNYGEEDNVSGWSIGTSVSIDSGNTAKINYGTKDKDDELGWYTNIGVSIVGGTKIPVMESQKFSSSIVGGTKIPVMESQKFSSSIVGGTKIPVMESQKFGATVASGIIT